MCAEHTELTAQLKTLEEQLLQPDTRRSAECVSALLADDFVEFGGSGRVFNKGEIIAALQAEAPARLELVNFQVKVLAEGVALATYRAVKHADDCSAPICSLRCSIWKHIDGHWRIVFHQGTLSSEL